MHDDARQLGKAAATRYLASLTPGYLPFEIFLQVARLTVTPIIEIVPLRRSENGTEVLLLERDASDPVWGGALHTPGTVLRANDKTGSFDDAFHRILQKELAGTKTSPPNFVQTLFHEVKRGRELATVFYVEVQAEPKAGKFHPARQLPDMLVDTQRGFIQAAVRLYESSQLL